MIAVWFMYDNHTFARVKSRERAALIDEATMLFAEDGCGSLFVRDEYGASLNALDLNGDRMPNGEYGVTKKQIELWADRILAEDSFRHRMHA